MTAPPTTPPPRRLWWLVAGFVVWSSAFVALYALHAIGCAFAWSAGPMRLWLALVLVAHLAVLAGLWLLLVRRRATASQGDTARFLHVAGLWATLAALVATFLVLAPPLLLTTCV